MFNMLLNHGKGYYSVRCVSDSHSKSYSTIYGDIKHYKCLKITKYKLNPIIAFSLHLLISFLVHLQL